MLGFYMLMQTLLSPWGFLGLLLVVACVLLWKRK